LLGHPPSLSKKVPQKQKEEFTDPTSYQTLFYFLVIKPFITLSITIAIIAFGVPLFPLPAPDHLPAVRKIRIWQANIAVEGLYIAVR